MQRLGHKLEANDFEVCANVKKHALDLDYKEIVDAINKKIKTSGLVQGWFDAMLDEGVPQDLLPSVAK